MKPSKVLPLSHKFPSPRRHQNRAWANKVLQDVLGILGGQNPPVSHFGDTLWLCQNCYWKWPLIVDFPIKNGDFR